MSRPITPAEMRDWIKQTWQKCRDEAWKEKGMTDYERGYEQGKTDATKKMHPEIRNCLEDYFDKCFKEYQEHLRPWVGLTDEEIGLLTTSDGWSHLETPVLALFSRAIESKLRSKNT